MVILPSIRRKYMNPRIPECVVTLASDSVSYTGGARTVGVTVTWGGEALSVNADYTLSFANNVNIGPATVTVTGMGQFSGSVTKTFYIVSSGTATWMDFDLTKTVFVGKSATPVGDAPSAWARVRAVSSDGKTIFPMHKKLYAVSFSSPMSLSAYTSTEATVDDVWYGSGSGNSSIAWSGDGMHYVAAGTRYSQYFYYTYLISGEVSSPYAIEEVSWDTNRCKVVDGNMGAVSVNNDGTRIFYTRGHGMNVAAGDTENYGLFAVNLETPFDMSTAGSPEPVLLAGSITDETRTLRNMFFSPDGTVLIAVWNRWVQKFSLSIPYDISTITQHSAFDPYVRAGNSGGTFSGCVIGNDGTKMILYSASDQSLYEFSLAA